MNLFFFQHQTVGRPPHGRLGDITHGQIVLASVQLHDHRFETFLRIFRLLGNGRLLGVGDGRRWLHIIFFPVQREGRGPHRAAALLHDREAGQKIADLVAAYAEADLVAAHPAFAFKIGHTVAVDDHTLEGQAVSLDRWLRGARGGKK